MPSYLFLLFVFSLFIPIFLRATESDNVLIDIQDATKKANILLLTAHPDDECLFFAPTVLALMTQKYSQMDTHSQGSTAIAPELFSLCLSTGNADGLGEIRKTELENSLEVLGIEDGKRWVVDHPYVSLILYCVVH